MKYEELALNRRRFCIAASDLPHVVVLHEGVTVRSLATPDSDAARSHWSGKEDCAVQKQEKAFIGFRVHPLL